jgi:hypothetical protein
MICVLMTVNAVMFISNDSVVAELLDLYDRTDDSAIKFEIARVFVNVTRCLSAESLSLHELDNIRIVTTMVAMLTTARDYPLLINESLIGLALIAKFVNGELLSYHANIRLHC